jgi:plastocyanin
MSAMSKHLRFFLPALLALGLLLSACSSSYNVPVNTAGNGGETSSQTPAVVVTLKYVSFEPGRVTIHVGQTVEWKWEDAPIAHNVTFAGFASPTQATGTFFHTFDTPGVYPYRCTIHATMVAEVVVLP